jgi:hypothetical protein
MEEIMMKAFFKGLLAAFTGFAMIAILVGCVYGLLYVGQLHGYVAVLAFAGFSAAMVGDAVLLCRIGKDGVYAKGNVRA